MAEKIEKIEKQIVTRATYDDARGARLSGSDLLESLLTNKANRDVQELNGRNFIIRLLFGDRELAEDRLVMLVGTDDLGGEYVMEGPRPLLISVRPINEDGSTGKQEPPYRLTGDGIILNKNENTPNFELGYFVGVPGLGVDDFYATAAEGMEVRTNSNDETTFQNYNKEINRRFI
jgi:hypothetical protein